MKKKANYFLLFLFVTILSSCTFAPSFNDQSNPFVITQIKQNNDTRCTYYNSKNDFFYANYGLYNIGDTVKMVK